MKNLLFTFVFAAITQCINAEVSITEKQALLDFYQATNGAEWNTTWNLDQPTATWAGLTVENDQVVGISLLFNNLKGMLPESLGQLTHLRTLELSFNQISGSLPVSLGNLSNLETLALSGNMISGFIPNEIGNLSKLKVLHLSSNLLSGTLPTSVEKLESIEIFNVFDNDLAGEIPTKLGAQKNLKELIVAENNFSENKTLSMIVLSNTGSSLDLNNPQSGNTITKSVIAVGGDTSNE